MKAAKQKQRERLESMNLLDLTLGAQLDKDARKALNSLREDIRSGL